MGAHNLKDVYKINRDLLLEMAEEKAEREKSIDEESEFNEDKISTGSVEERPKIKEEEIDEYDVSIPPNPDALTPVSMKSIESEAKYAIEKDRVIDAGLGRGASTLFEFMPPTKIKGWCNTFVFS